MFWKKAKYVPKNYMKLNCAENPVSILPLNVSSLIFIYFLRNVVKMQNRK